LRFVRLCFVLLCLCFVYIVMTLSCVITLLIHIYIPISSITMLEKSYEDYKIFMPEWSVGRYWKLIFRLCHCNQCNTDKMYCTGCEDWSTDDFDYQIVLGLSNTRGWFKRLLEFDSVAMKPCKFLRMKGILMHVSYTYKYIFIFHTPSIHPIWLAAFESRIIPRSMWPKGFRYYV
jgi:hypothetical protein